MSRLIDLWEHIARKAMGIRPAFEGAVVGYTIRRYPGRLIRGEDGFTAVRGDPVIELHLDSRLLQARTAGTSTHQRVMFLRREMLSGLKAIAQLVKNDPKLASTRGIWALTLFHRGVEHFGFTVIDVPPGFARSITSRYMKWLLASYHPEGQDRLHQREEQLVTKEIFLSKESLLIRFGGERRSSRGQPEAALGE